MRAAETDEPAATSPRRDELRAAPGGFEWLLQRDALAAVYAALARRTTAQLAYLGRAQLALEFADRALEPIQGLRVGSSAALALSIYREAAYWALLAHKPRDGRDFAGAFDGADPTLLLRAAGDAETLALLRSVLVEQNFVASAEASEEVVRAEAAAVRTFVRELLFGLQEPERRLRATRLRRSRRVAAFAFALAVGLGLGGWKLRELSRSPDLALGKPWRTSTKYADCHPEQNTCAGATTSILFHTRSESNPWFEIDLGGKQTFSVVEITNRTDCCPDRAFPLVVEVSDDQTHWKAVARIDRPFFANFTFHFKPTTARYVRLRAPRVVELHLVRVAVRAS